jgi:hypothetical protein
MVSVTARRFKKSTTFKKEDLISSNTGQYRVKLISRIEFVSSLSYKFLPNTYLQFLIVCIYDATCHFYNCACYCTKENRYPQWAEKYEVGKYKIKLKKTNIYI